jgi:hypothetical protein
VIVARPSKWGNPYTVAMMQERLEHDELQLDLRELVVEAFRSDLEHGPDSVWWWFGPHMKILDILDGLDAGELRGRDLACWCPLDQPCHADVLLELANPASPNEGNDRG